MDRAPEPSYDLLEAQHLVRTHRYMLSAEVSRTLARDGFNEYDLIEVVEALTPDDFHKCVPSHRDERIMLDVYRPVHDGRRIYFKFKIIEHAGLVYVLSFKEDDHP